jgi:hypothetical protein
MADDLHDALCAVTAYPPWLFSVDAVNPEGYWGE